MTWKLLQVRACFENPLIRSWSYCLLTPPIRSVRAPESYFTERCLQHFCFQGFPGKNVYGLGGPLPTNTPSLVHSHISNDQHSITSALPHLKTINTTALLHAHISKRPTLHHFCTPTCQNDQHSITFTLLHLKISTLYRYRSPTS